MAILQRFVCNKKDLQSFFVGFLLQLQLPELFTVDAQKIIKRATGDVDYVVNRQHMESMKWHIWFVYRVHEFH